MKVKQIAHGQKAFEKAKEGVDLAADTIKQTLGPKGRNVLLSKLGPLPPRIVNDGKTILEEVEADRNDPDYPFIQAGVRMCQEISKRTDHLAGDGTTTTTFLAQKIIEQGSKRILSGENPMDIKRQLETDTKSVIEELHKMSRPCESRQEVKGVATIAANNDDKAGEAIASIIEEVGKNASIMVEKSFESDLRIERVKGIFFDKGFASPAFATDYRGYKAEYEDALICVTDRKIQWHSDIEEFFEKLHKMKADKVILIADEIEGEALDSLSITNRIALGDSTVPIQMVQNIQGIHIIGINAPEFGPTRHEILEDICVMTGATLISQKNNITFDDASPEVVLGGCKKIICTSNTTTIVGGHGNERLVQERIEALKAEIEQLHVNAKTTREKLEKRLSILEAGVGIIHAGGPTEVEVKERCLRLEDAILATRSAVKGGYVEGGGHTYLRLAGKTESPILKVALKEVVKQIAQNAGKTPDMVLEQCEKTKKGWNAKTDKFEDLLKSGVLDATLVVESCIRNAVSLGSYFLTMASMVCEDISEGEKKK